VAPLETQSVIFRSVVVAAGRFAPGHLGELTQQVPFEMVDDVLALTGRMQARVRDLPSRVVVYLLLAGALFAEAGYRQVWPRLVAGLGGLPVAMPTSSALAQARRRVGAAPLQALFGLLAGPAAGAARWRGLLVCAVDGTTMFVPDSPANLGCYGRQSGTHGGSGYPMLRLVAVVACGTRTILGAVFGPYRAGELSYAPRLLGCLRPGMLLLADRNFAVAGLINQIASTGADLLIRCKNGRRLPPTGRLPDGSWLTRCGPLTLRVLDAEITATLGSRTQHTGRYRLVTTLLDHRRHPAIELVKLYHQRWEIEMVFPQLAKGPVRPVGGGWQHVADLGLAVGDDHAVDQQLGQLPPLGEGGGGQPGPDGLAEPLDPVGDAGEFQALLGDRVELALLGQ
jgi:hypothetical protein